MCGCRKGRGVKTNLYSPPKAAVVKKITEKQVASISPPVSESTRTETEASHSTEEILTPVSNVNKKVRNFKQIPKNRRK